MTEIIIKDSKLLLVQLNYKLNDSKINGIDKKDLKYQTIYFITPTKEDSALCKELNIYGVDNTIVPTEISQIYEEAWVIKNNKIKGDTDYDWYDRSTLLSILSTIYKSHIDTAELICHAIGDGNLLNSFYSSYGDMSSFENNIVKVLNSTKLSPISNRFHKIYQKSTYCVYQLLQDLVKDKAFIYTDSELIGDYERISRLVKTSSTRVPDKWSKIMGLSGNRTRANISVSYMGNVSVNVPENKFGVESGKRELNTVKSICIIKDGVLWTSEIGVRISKALYKKLSKKKIIKASLIGENEYLIDLKRLPVISKNMLRVSSFDMAKSEAKIKLYSLAIGYLNMLDYMKGKKLTIAPDKKEKEIDPKETFLHSLGIYGDKYIAPKIESEVTDHYESLCIEAKLSGIPNDFTTSIRNFINKGNCRNKVVESYLKTLPKTITLDELEKERKEEIKKLRLLKFRLIMSKNLRFKEYLSPKVTDKVVNVPIAGNYITVKWELSNKEIEI